MISTVTNDNNNSKDLQKGCMHMGLAKCSCQDLAESEICQGLTTPLLAQANESTGSLEIVSY